MVELGNHALSRSPRRAPRSGACGRALPRRSRSAVVGIVRARGVGQDLIAEIAPVDVVRARHPDPFMLPKCFGMLSPLIFLLV